MKGQMRYTIEDELCVEDVEIGFNPLMIEYVNDDNRTHTWIAKNQDSPFIFKHIVKPLGLLPGDTTALKINLEKKCLEGPWVEYALSHESDMITSGNWEVYPDDFDKFLHLIQKQTYKEDEALWRDKMISLLEENKLNEIDATNLIVVLAEMGKSDQRSVRSVLTELILHILKAMYQPERASRSWYVSIKKQQHFLREIFEDSPSLKNIANDNFDRCYRDGRRFALDETGLDYEDIPEEPVLEFEAILTTMPKSLSDYVR